MPGAANRELPDDFASFLKRDMEKDLLRFTTAGSVDDGKSTLIGRLLHDSKSVYEDQLASVKKSRINRSGGVLDFALLTDGLRAEREQGITIDVAYRYFATPRRKFIIADTPGHEQYTRNMATGASTADLAVILIDATKGLVSQTRRHAYIASLLGIPNVLAAINKMDLADYQEDVFLTLRRDCFALAKQLDIPNVLAVPISALTGDNVVSRSPQMPWYQGPTFLDHLEMVPVRPAVEMEALRFPVQYVIRPDAGSLGQTDFRGFAGQVASGVIRPGDSVMALPSGRKTRIRSIITYDGELSEAFHPMTVTVRLEDEIDLSRGDMLVSPDSRPHVSRHFEAMVVWLHAKPLELARNYLLKHTVQTTRAKAVEIRYRVDVNTFSRDPARQLEMNDIACVEFESAAPLFFDPYDRNRALGSFILIDPISNATVGAAMIRANLNGTSANLWARQMNARGMSHRPVPPATRYVRHGHYPALILAEGRYTLASVLECALFERGFEVLLVTDDQVPAADLSRLASVAHSAGLILIYSGASTAPAAKPELRELAADRLFELSAMDLAVNDWEAVGQVLRLIESLRISGGLAESEKGG